MTLQEALSIDPVSSNKETMKEATITLKRVYGQRRTILKDKFRGKTPVIKHTEKILSNIPDIRIGKLSKQGLEKRYTIYKDFLESETSTSSGYKNYLIGVENIIGIEGYSSRTWTESQRTKLWTLIDEVKSIGPEFFTGSDYLYKSDYTLSTIGIIIDKTKTEDPQEILNLLELNADLIKSNTVPEGISGLY